MEKDQNTTKRGELYGNRVPGLSRPHIPVPPSSKTDQKQPRSRSASRLELDRYATSPSPPGSPFLTSDNGDSVGDVLSDGYPDTPNDTVAFEENQQQSIDALVASASDDVPPEEQEETVGPASVADVESDRPDPGADQLDESPAIFEPPSEPEPAEDALPPAVHVSPTLEPKAPTPPPVTDLSTKESDPEPEPEPASASVEDAVDPDVQAVIDMLDRATRMGEAGAVVVPAVSLQAIAELGDTLEQQNSVQDLLDQLLLQEDMLDVATPIKQRFSLNGSLSQLAVRNYLAQQSELAAKESRTFEIPEKKQVQPSANTQSSSQFLSPATPSAYSPDSPVAEPLSPASDIYASYMVPTPSVPFGRALPAIPEAPDSPAALTFKDTRRGTFGSASGGSTPPSSAPLVTPNDESNAYLRDGSVKTNVNLGRIASPPLSVVIPSHSETPNLAQPTNIKAENSTPPSQPAPTVRSLPAPPDSAGVSVTSPGSAYSATSSYSGEGSSPSSGSVSRKVSTRRKAVSPLPPISPYEEPVLTPIEGPKGFHAVVHEKVVEGKSRPVSMIMQYPDLPSPTPMNAGNMSDLAMLLADAAMLERRLSDNRPPQKRLPSRPSVESKSTPTPPPATGRRTSDRPRPVQDLPESPDDPELFNRLSQDQSTTSRTSQYDSSRQPQYDSSRNSARQSQHEHRPLPTRPSVDRERKTSMSRPSLDRQPSRPSLERMPSRPSLDPSSSSARPSVDSTSSRPALQPLFLSADPNTVRIPLPARPKSAMAHSSGSRSQAATPPVPPPKSPPKTGYLTNLLSRAKSSGNLRSDPRDSVGSSSEDSVMVSTPPTPPYEMSGNETGSNRSSRMFKNSFSRASSFADRLLHRKEGSNQGPEVAIASGDEDDQMAGSRSSLQRPARPLPLPPRPQPPRGLPPPVPGEPFPSNASNSSLAPIPPPGQPGLQRRGSWKSIASVSTTGISEALDGVYDSFPSVPENVPRTGLPSGPNAYIAPRPAPRPPAIPPPSQPLPPPPSQPLPPPPRGASHNHGLSSANYPGLPSNPAQRPRTLPSRPKLPPQKAPPSGALRSGMI
ncbi:hypothetical protein OH76DRAFT_812391 [Lentinus brumalis]|uniref:Uncharacterized protein n=1 Tax=Lentinus brumalis TaxID=2498619 RepID=A0A371D311_9APHY|nr:hypothetical protein OH76DRAFT_812391 [Polyporus brumalis]